MAEVILKISDTEDGKEVQIECHSSNMADEKSAANSIAEFLGASWSNVIEGAKLYAEAVRQARAAKAAEEATGVIPEADVPELIRGIEPKILKADGSGVHEATGS